MHWTRREIDRTSRGLKVNPVATIDQLHFKGKVFFLKGVDTEKQDKTYTLLTLSISPDFFGNRSAFLMKALKALGVRDISFVGTAGGLAGDSKVGDVMAPVHLANFSEGRRSEGRYENKAPSLIEKLDSDGTVKKSDFRESQLHFGVHSPITESDDMIKTMKSSNVDSVDCEAGFIADALKNSDVNLYALFFVGDVPGTHHSIGQGGVSDGLAEDDDKETAPTESAVLGMIKMVIGKEIEAADEKLTEGSYPISKTGEIIGATYPATESDNGRQAKIQIKLLLPEVGTSNRTPGVIKNFHKQISAILDKSGKILDLKAQNAINRLAATFFDNYKIKFTIDFS
jgi:nucleoside phosphorylase